MILEVLRILKDALDTGGSTPLATELAALDLDGSDAVPATPTIVDATRSHDVAVGRAPSTLPALTIAFDEMVDLDPRSSQGTRDGEVAVLFRFVDREPNGASAVRDALYTLRALERCLDRLPFPITRNQIAMYSCTERRYLSLMKPIEDQWLVAGLRVVFQCRDNAP